VPVPPGQIDEGPKTLSGRGAAFTVTTLVAAQVVTKR